jgi:hypothetical protein
MYVLSKNFENPEQEIVCPWTGESYVYVDKIENPDHNDGALEILPERFFKRPLPLRCPDGQVKLHIRI